MQKLGIYLIILVIGSIIGASSLAFVILNQDSSISEQVKVTIQGIEYETSDYSVLKIELLNDVPERNLDGMLIVSQGEKQWIAGVTWYYTGQGEATVLCDGINENQSFRIKYDEKNPKATYLDRIIDWQEVETEEMVIGFMETSELTVTNVDFTPGDPSGQIAVDVTNSGTSAVTVTQIKVNGETAGTWSSGTSDTIEPGADETFTITQAVVAGNKYSISMFANDGTLIGSYTETA
ncbi:MAG: hypothetical protein JSV76_05405 [Candidatus Bathyarchaeota archaeon]|nr:MAG: hypothetical protein JSV76_05405 [Candidatus Bathyarchaeota archaeon]